MRRRRKKKEWDIFFEELKEILVKLEIDYRETSRIKSKGALCSVRGKRVLIVNRRLGSEDKADLLRRETAGEDIEALYLKPELREYLEKR